MNGIKKIKNNSEPKMTTSKSNKPSIAQSAIQIGKDHLDELVTQVPNAKDEDRIDLQNLTNIEEIQDFYDFTENCLIMISKLTVPPLKEIESLQLDLPEKLVNNKKLAIFDLDETLIHCELKNPKKADYPLTIKLPNGKSERVSLIIYIVFLPTIFNL
jgi:hypothetical protein